MPNTISFINKFRAVFTPPRLGVARKILPLMDQTSAIIQTQSSETIFIENNDDGVPILTANRIRSNLQSVVGILST